MHINDHITYYAAPGALPILRPLVELLPADFKLCSVPLKLPKTIQQLLDKQPEFTVNPSDKVADCQRLALLNMGEFGYGLMAIGQFSAQEYLVYDGKPLINPKQDGLYCLGCTIAGQFIASDAAQQGSLSRFIQHLPDRYEGPHQAIATANMQLQFIRLQGKYFHAIKFKQAVIASPEQPILLGYDYGMARYWQNLGEMPSLFTVDGQPLVLVK